MNATLIQKCKDLAAASLAEYKGEHGEPPWTEQEQAEIEERFTADFRGALPLRCPVLSSGRLSRGMERSLLTAYGSRLITLAPKHERPCFPALIGGASPLFEKRRPACRHSSALCPC